MRARRPSFLALALLAACTSTPTGVKTPRASASASLPPVPGASTPVVATGLASPGAVTPAPVGVTPSLAVAPVLSNNGANLTGIVRAPATLISDKGGEIIGNNGAGIISNNGGGIVSDHGGGYRLQADVKQVPVAGVVVRLLDGAGGPILIGGQPATDVTDAQGRYAFNVTLADQNWVVSADLPASRGSLLAIAPRVTGARTADLDLVSTLVTSYILTEYVATQPDKQATLDRLPPDVEADTRAKATNALVAASIAVPAGLTAADAHATVEAMRKADTTFDAQLETVKRLLIPAGRADLGSGTLGTQVELFGVERLALAADGGLYVPSVNKNNPDLSRLWRLGTDGKLVGVQDGQVGDLALDAQRRPVLMLQDRIEKSTLDFTLGITFGNLGALGPAAPMRVEASGGVTTLAAKIPAGLLAIPGADGRVTCLSTPWQQPSAWITVGPAADALAAPAGVALDQPTAVIAPGIAMHGLDATGKSWALAGQPTDDAQTLYAFDPTTRTFTRTATRDDLAARALVLAATGELLVWGKDGSLALRQPGGSLTTLLAATPADLRPSGAGSVAVAADGVYLAQHDRQVYKLAGGKLTLVAGLATEADAPAAVATNLDLKTPSGVAFAPTGLVVADADAHKLYRFAADGTATTLAGSGVAVAGGDGGPAIQAGLTRPRAVQVDATGNVLFLDDLGDGIAGIRRIDAAGKIGTFYKPATGSVVQMVLAGDGTIYAIVARATGGDLVSLDAAGKETVRVAGDANYASTSALALDRLGVLVLAKGAVTRWHLDAQGQPVREDVHAFTTTLSGGPLGALFPTISFPVGSHTYASYPNGLAVDARGRLYLSLGSSGLPNAQRDDVIVRFDPADGSLHVLAGSGGTIFAGTAVDDSLAGPCYPTFEPDGSLLFADADHRQIKRVPADRL